MTPYETRQWEEAVLEKHHSRCDACGGTDRVRVCSVVAPQAGGALDVSNGYTICRACEMARDIQARGGPSKRQPINFWVSRALFETLERLTTAAEPFRSMGELVRYLIDFYLRCQADFEDLSFYQDRGSDVKVNAWVDASQYEAFKSAINAQGLTVTDGLKALVLFYDLERARMALPVAAVPAKDTTSE